MTIGSSYNYPAQRAAQLAAAQNYIPPAPGAAVIQTRPICRSITAGW